VVAGASAVIFLLLAVVAHLMVGMHDRSSPIVLGSPPRVVLDFAGAGVQDEAAVDALRGLDEDFSLGLVKQGADLNGDLRGIVLIPVSGTATVPSVVGRYQDAPARLVGRDAWEFTTVTGTYYVTGDATALPTATTEFERLGVVVSQDDTTVWTGLQGVIRLPAMLLAVLTGCVLLVTLVLYWLSVKARRRALGVLAGNPVARIQVHDLGQLMALVVAVWLPASALAAVVIGWWRGWAYVAVFAGYLGFLGGFMLSVALVAAVLMSAVSIPSPALIARRRPTTVGVLRTAGVLKAATFVAVLLVIGPVWGALDRAMTQAEQLSRWERLADYASVVFPDVSDVEYNRLGPGFADVVGEGEEDDAVLFSTTYAPEEGEQREFGTVLSDHVGPRWAALSFVNQRWLDVMAAEEQTDLVEVPTAEVPKQELVAWFDGVWQTPGRPGEQTVASLRYLSPATGTVPVIANGGDLEYRDDVLLIVVPSVSETFNDSALLNTASGSDLLFAGVDETQARLESHGLARDIKVQQAAEAGVLLAQFAAYEAWLGAVSIVGLGVALAISAAISAYIAMLLQAKNDFARRLSGQAWLRVLSGRVAPELVVGGVIAAAAVLLQPSQQVVPVLATGVLLLVASPVMHVLAGRRGFADVAARRL
jgi:hypothetical protein